MIVMIVMTITKSQITTITMITDTEVVAFGETTIRLLLMMDTT